MKLKFGGVIGVEVGGRVKFGAEIDAIGFWRRSERISPTVVRPLSSFEKNSFSITVTSIVRKEEMHERRRPKRLG